MDTHPPVVHIRQPFIKRIISYYPSSRDTVWFSEHNPWIIIQIISGWFNQICVLLYVRLCHRRMSFMNIWKTVSYKRSANILPVAENTFFVPLQEVVIWSVIHFRDDPLALTDPDGGCKTRAKFNFDVLDICLWQHLCTIQQWYIEYDQHQLLLLCKFTIKLSSSSLNQVK